MTAVDDAEVLDPMYPLDPVDMGVKHDDPTTWMEYWDTAFPLEQRVWCVLELSGFVSPPLCSRGYLSLGRLET
jgi:hypothetical protein